MREVTRNRLIQGWLKFFCGEISAETVAAFRISFGLVALANEYMWCGWIRELLSDQGFFPRSVVKLESSPLSWSLFYFSGSTVWAWTLYLVLVSATVAFTLGFRPRTCSFVAWLLASSVRVRAPLIWNGPLNLMCIGFFYCIALDTGRAFRFFGKPQGAFGRQMVPIWPARMLQLQLTMIYFFTSIEKLTVSPQWFDGTYLFHILNIPTFAIFDMDWLSDFPLIALGMNWFAIATELLLPVLLWIPKTRRLALLLGLALHLGISAMMNVDWFSETLLAYYVLFLRPEEIQMLINLTARVCQRTRAWLLAEGKPKKRKSKTTRWLLDLGLSGLILALSFGAISPISIWGSRPNPS